MATSAAAMARAQGKIVAYFYAMHAISPEDAVAYKPERLAQARQFERMRAKGIIQQVTPGQYWLHIPGWEADKEARRKRMVLIVLAVLLFGAIVPLFFYQG
jgi:hypothetical protein